MTTDDLPACLRRYVAGLRAHDLPQIAATVADDLAFVTPARTIDKASFLSFLEALYHGFPDWWYEDQAVEAANPGRYAIRWRQGGTHSGPLALPGWPPARPTGRVVEIRAHRFFYQADDDLIVMIRPEPVPGAAPRGIFEQIGVEPPF